MSDEATTTSAALPSYQRAWLRGQAHDLDPVVIVGQAGITDGVIEAVAAALLAHELIKVRLHRPEDKKAMAAEVAQRSGAHLCGLVGHTVILYKPHPEKPQLELPARVAT